MDPFGPSGAETFHLPTHVGAGDYMDRWFTKGIGVVQEVAAHHGTYGESRRRLVRAVIDGKALTYDLKRAGTIPLDASDCDGPGWQHYVRLDGAAFRSMAECAAYGSKRR